MQSGKERESSEGAKDMKCQMRQTLLEEQDHRTQQ